jgi:trehalose-6-phosphate synthase
MLDGGKFFFSVERFDYTKGIKEKLMAIRRFFEKHPDRIGKDVIKQVRNCIALICHFTNKQ